MDFGWLGDLFGGGDNDKQTTTQNDWQMAPEFPEAAGARANLYEM